MLVVASEVADAMAGGGAVVALESTLIAHGLPRPGNFDVAREIEAAVREEGAVPATVALLDGVVRIGLDDAALEHAREAGLSISVDPASAAPLEAAGPRAFLDWVAHADVLLPNLEEAVVLTGARDPEAAAWALARDGREVVITLGADGALWSDGERVVRAAAATAPAPVDSTGAGDAFTAGWLAARLDRAEPAEALAAANELAARALGGAGAR